MTSIAASTSWLHAGMSTMVNKPPMEPVDLDVVPGDVGRERHVLGGDHRAGL